MIIVAGSSHAMADLSTVFARTNIISPQAPSVHCKNTHQSFHLDATKTSCLRTNFEVGRCFNLRSMHPNSPTPSTNQHKARQNLKQSFPTFQNFGEANFLLKR